MKKVKGNILGMDFSPESREKRMRENYAISQLNPENMSYWLPKILSSTTKANSILQIPETKIIQLDYPIWKWLRSDSYTPEKVKEFNDYIVDKIDDFLSGKTLFMKTGIFSNKFTFSMTVIDDRESIGQNLLDIYYNSMVLGADNTSEVAIREMIHDKENRAQIYSGMPLHTEFRVFYDYDTYEIVGVANYWHPDVMTRGLYGKDVLVYEQEKEKIIADFNKYKNQVAEEVQAFMKGCTELSGKWSIDIMKNGEDFWLIDMARMERSALVSQIEQI